MSIVEHTATPWEIGSFDPPGPDFHAIHEHVGVMRADRTCLAYCGPWDDAESQADAEYIVRCVNAFDDLVAALRAIRGSAQTLKNQREYTDLPVEYMAELSAYARLTDEALEKAGES